MAGLQNTFGEQQAQTTGQLTQAAGGVGADRIAVGQADLANQQGLAAGQTLSGLYTGAAQQAQSAGYGTAATGSGLENSMLTGAQAQLGTGGLQQQLQQAQLNSPYQQQLAQLAYPFQTSQFLSGAVGALAPGLGGTTYGTGSTTSPSPSLLSQILGLGTAGVGIAGQSGAFGSTSSTNPKGSSPSYGGGNIYSGDAYGGSASNPLPGLSESDYGARGGSFGSPYARGGGAFAQGGAPATTGVYSLPSGFNDNPINIDSESIVPQGQLPQAQTHQPTLNLSAPAPAANNNGAAQAIGTAVKVASMFMKKGGKVGNPYAFADGGDTGGGSQMQPLQINPQIRARMERRMQNASSDEETQRVIKDAAKYGVDWSEYGHARGGRAFADGGTPDSDDSGLAERLSRVMNSGRNRGQRALYNDTRAGLNNSATAPDEGSTYGGLGSGLNQRRRLQGYEAQDIEKAVRGYADGGAPDDSVWNPDEPYRMPDQAAVDDWRKGADTAMAFAPSNSATPASFPQVSPAAAGAPAASAPASPANPYSSAPAATSGSDPEDDSTSFAKSPWLALTAAGLGIAGGTSPFALTNIGQGAMAGVKTLEQQREAAQKDKTVEQAAKRLDQEARFHQDQYTKMTPYQQGELNAKSRSEALAEQKPIALGTDAIGNPILGVKDPDHPGHFLDPITHQPVAAPNAEPAPQFKPPGGGSAPAAPGAPVASAEDTTVPPAARYTQMKPGIDTPEGTHPEVLASLPPELAATVRAIDEGRANLSSIGFKNRTAVMKLVNQYDDNFDQTTFALRNAQNRDLSTNGNAGKMILAVNQLLPHLKTASDKAAALDNGDYPAANSIANFWATQTGDPRVKTFEEVREVAAMDAARLLRGSGSMAEKDIEFWRQNLSAAGSPAQLQSQINLLADDLMGARIGSIKQSYEMNMRKKAPDFVSPEAKEALTTIKSRLPGQNQNAAAPAANAAAPAAAAPAAPAASDPLAQARAAIAAGAPREAVIKRLQDHGVNPAGL